MLMTIKFYQHTVNTDTKTGLFLSVKDTVRQTTEPAQEVCKPKLEVEKFLPVLRH